jgi:hypothetical protein
LASHSCETLYDFVELRGIEPQTSRVRSSKRAAITGISGGYFVPRTQPAFDADRVLMLDDVTINRRGRIAARRYSIGTRDATATSS